MGFWVLGFRVLGSTVNWYPRAFLQVWLGSGQLNLRWIAASLTQHNICPWSGLWQTKFLDIRHRNRRGAPGAGKKTHHVLQNHQNWLMHRSQVTFDPLRCTPL